MKHFSNVTSFVVIIFLSFFIFACSKPTDPSAAYPDKSQQTIFVEGRDSLKNRNFTDAIKHFEALDVQYPYGKQTQIAQLDLIYAYYMKEDYALSVSAADRFIKLYPTYPDVDYAYYMRGLANYYQNMGVIERYFSIDLSNRDLTQIKHAYANFQELIAKFPQSRYAAPAYQRMIYLRNLLATHELHVADYYYQRKAYVASADRATDLIRHYQGAPTVKDALIMLVKSYEKLGMTNQANDARRVLNYNYPTAVID